MWTSRSRPLSTDGRAALAGFDDLDGPATVGVRRVQAGSVTAASSAKALAKKGKRPLSAT